MSDDKFQAWVKKWRIGPGMNDRNRQIAVREYLDKGGQELLDEHLYSGFDGSVGAGWIPILDRLAADLIAMGWDRDLHQIKEKFGGLRFYIGAGTKEMHDRIDQAEEEAWKTCEQCGAPGTPKGPGWILTLCEPCRAAKKR